MLGRWPENGRTKSQQLRPPPDFDTAPYPALIPSPSPDLSNHNNDHVNDQYFSSVPSNNMTSNFVIFPALSTLPHGITTPLPAGSTPAPAGCASPHPCSSTTSPASNTLLPYDKELHVPDLPPAVHCDQPPDAMPRPTRLTAFSTAHSDNCVVRMSRSLTGHGRGHGVKD